MTRIIALPLFAFGLALAGCDKGAPDGNATAAAGAPSLAPIPAPAGRSWAETVAMTSEGGVRMGNPDAPVKLVEWGSFTCPHCADFSVTATPKLRDDYVASGRVSWEFRPFLLNALDVPITLLTRCGGAEPFFKLAEQVYANQREWMAQLQQLPQDRLAALQSLPPAQQFTEFTKLSGFDRFFAVRGLPSAKQGQCLADKATADRLVAMRDEATEKQGITGTPGFLINGEVVPNAATWETLEPALRAALS